MNEYELAGIETIARGVLIRDGKLLLCKAKGGATSYLPGGHIEFGETGREALVREMREEAGVECCTKDFLGVVENSFLQHGKKHCEINLVYSMQIDDEEITSKEDWIEFFFQPLAKLSEAHLLPDVFNQLSSPPAFFRP